MNLFFTILLIMIITNTSAQGFKAEQILYSRVKTAYSEKEDTVKKDLSIHKISTSTLRIYVRVFKEDQIMELWAKNTSDKKYVLIKEFPICSSSGDIGPKRRLGDGQVPEGFYNIDRFNPFSNFYLSLGVNYPNKSDRIISDADNPGGDIFIHGSCVTIGCVPITDELIKEFYIYCVEARNSGQEKISVTFFPKKLTDSNFAKLIADYKDDKDKTNLWTDLKAAYDYFETKKELPTISFLPSGRHKVSKIL